MKLKKVRPEDIDPVEFAKFIQELSNDPRIKEMVDSHDEGAKFALKDSLAKCKKIGVEINEKNALGFLYHFSMCQAMNFYELHKKWNGDCLVEAFARMLIRHYKAIYELIQAEEAIKCN